MSTLVDATGTRRRLEALAALGWSASQIGRHLGRPPGSARALISSWRNPNRRYIHRDTAAQVAQVYTQLAGTLGPCSKLRVYAGRQGWSPPTAWHGRDIDDTGRAVA